MQNMIDKSLGKRVEEGNDDVSIPKTVSPQTHLLVRRLHSCLILNMVCC
jgi:hypothetical protein